MANQPINGAQPSGDDDEFEVIGPANDPAASDVIDEVIGAQPRRRLPARGTRRLSNADVRDRVNEPAKRSPLLAGCGAAFIAFLLCTTAGTMILTSMAPSPGGFSSGYEQGRAAGAALAPFAWGAAAIAFVVVLVGRGMNPKLSPIVVGLGAGALGVAVIVAVLRSVT